MTIRRLFNKFAAILSFVLLLQFISPTAAQAVESSATLTGHVYSSEDRSTPIQNVGISSSFGFASSAQDGGFTLTNLRAGNITLWVSKESPSNSTTLGRFISKQVAVGLVAGSNNIDIFLTPYASGPNNISGTISDEADAPVPAAQLSLSSGNWPNTRYFQVNSRADGTFDFTDLPSGKYQVSIYKSELNLDNMWVQAFYPKNFEITLPLQSSRVNWHIVRNATKLLSGVVAAKNNSTLVYENASVSVCVVTFGQNICQWSRTDALGEYSVSLPPGNGTLSVYAPEFRYLTETVTMGVDDTTHNVEVDPYPIGTLSIEGMVTDESGTPLAGVTVITSSAFPVPSQTSGSDGKFKFENLLSGQYNFSVYADGFNAPNSSRYVQLASTNKTGVNIKMQRAGTETLSGRVLDAAGSPVDGANITVEQVGGNYRANSLWVTTDALGQYTVGQLTPGQTYSLYANKNGYLTSNKVKVQPQSEPVTLELRPWKTGNSVVQGTVKDSNGNPIESQGVYLNFNSFNGYGDSQYYSLSTNSLGEFRFENLPSGQAQLSSSLSGGTNCYKTLILNGNDTKSADCKFYEKTSTVELQFVSSTGAILNPDNVSSESCGSPCVNQQLTWSEGSTGTVSEYLSGTFDPSTGTTTFSGVPKSSDSVLRWSMSQNAYSDEYLPGGWLSTPIVLDTTVSSVTKKIIVPSIQGTNSVNGVVRNDSGLALEGVKLSWSSWAQQNGDQYSKSGIVLTDSSGAYSIPDLIENSAVYIYFDPSEQIDPAYKAETGITGNSIWGQVPATPTSRTRNMVLKYEASIDTKIVREANGSYTTRLVDVHGDPVVGVSASLSGPNVGQIAISDADGTIQFSDLEAGLYYFYVDSDSTAPYIPMSQGVTVAITSEALTKVEANPFVMQATPRGVGGIKGKLLDKDSNIGVTGLSCEASLIQLDDESVRNYWPWEPCNLDGSGDWSVNNLPAGNYSVRFVANQDENGKFANQFELPATLSVHVDGTSITDRGTDYVKVYSLKTDASVVVSLYDSESRLPISHVVNCNLQSPSISGVDNWTPTKSDKNGKVTFTNLVAGKTYELSCGTTTRLRLIAQDGVKTARAYIEQYDAKFMGRITDSQGNPLPGIRVEGNRTKEIIAKELACRCGDGEMWTVDETDADGYYYLNGVRHGESILQITDKTGKYAPISKPLALMSGTNPDINVQLKLGASVTGTLTDGSGKSLLDSSFVYLEAVNQASSMYWASPIENTSGFAFNSPVGEGDYFVSVNSFGGEGSTNFGSGYLQNDGSIKLAKSTAKVIRIRPDVEAKVTLPPLVQESAGSISGQLLFKSSDGTQLGSDYLSGTAAIYYQDGAQWVKATQLTTWVGVWNGGSFKFDGVLPGAYKVKFEDGGSGLFGESFANNQTGLGDATTYVVTAGQKTIGANGTLSYSLPTLSSSNFLTLQSLNEGQITILREAVVAQQVGKRVRVKAPDDMVGQYVAATISSSNVSRASIGIASATSSATSWMQVDSEGYITIPEQYIGANDGTFVFVNAKNIAVGIADIAGVAPVVVPPPVVVPTPPVVTPTPPQLVTQTPGTRVPSTFKPGKKLVLKAKTNLGSAVKVTAKGCKVSPTYKTTISYKTKKVGKRTIRTRVTTKTLISYSVTMGKKGSTCTVTQKSPATTTLAAMTSVTAIKVK